MLQKALQLKYTFKYIKCKEAQKLIEIARSTGMTISEILQYDLLTNNALFEGQSSSKPEKHKIVTRLENRPEACNFILKKYSGTGVFL